MRNKTTLKRHKVKAFTLLEMSVVIAIIAMMLGGVAVGRNT